MTFITKGTRVRIESLKDNPKACLAGMQMKVVVTHVSFTESLNKHT